MTCIVGIAQGGQVWLGGDRSAVEGSRLSIVDEPKVFVLGLFVIGYTSSFRMGQVLQHGFTPPAPPEHPDELARFFATTFSDGVRCALRDAGWLKTKDQCDEGGIFLVGCRGRLFCAESDFTFLSRTCGYDACGSGESVALGSLFSTSPDLDPVNRLRTALAAAQSFVTSVRGPFDVVSVR